MDGPSLALAFKFKLQLQVEPGRVPFRRGCFLTVTVKMLPKKTQLEGSLPVSLDTPETSTGFKLNLDSNSRLVRSHDSESASGCQ
jgi:hypothetical protein